MELNDAQLIQRTLQGDQEAFGPLVKKYQKGNKWHRRFRALLLLLPLTVMCFMSELLAWVCSVSGLMNLLSVEEKNSEELSC